MGQPALTVLVDIKVPWQLLIYDSKCSEWVTSWNYPPNLTSGCSKFTRESEKGLTSSNTVWENTVLVFVRKWKSVVLLKPVENHDIVI